MDPVQAAVARTVKVEIDCPGEDRDTGGTGVRYSGRLVVTAAHVIDNVEGCDIALVDEDGRESALYLDRSDDLDLGLLLTSGPAQPIVGLARAHLGMEVLSVGYPVQLTRREGAPKRPLCVTRGVLSVLNVEPGMHRVTAPVFYGNSGGGVWDMHGNLVGIAVEIRFFGGSYVSDHSRIVPAPLVARFVEDALR